MLVYYILLRCRKKCQRRLVTLRQRISQHYSIFDGSRFRESHLPSGVDRRAVYPPSIMENNLHTPRKSLLRIWSILALLCIVTNDLSATALADTTVRRLIDDNRYYIGLYPSLPRDYRTILPLINNYHDIDNLKLKAEAAYIVGSYYMHVADAENALKYFVESEKLYTQTGQWGKYMSVAKEYCNLSRMIGNSAVVIPTLNKCLDIARRHPVGFYILDPLHELSVHLAYEAGDYHGAVKYGLMFLDTLQKYQRMGIRDSEFEASQHLDRDILHLELGHAYIFLGDLEKAKYYLGEAEKAFVPTKMYGRLTRLYKYLALWAAYKKEPDSLVSYVQKFNRFEQKQIQVRYARIYHIPRLTRELSSLDRAYSHSQEEVRNLTRQNYYVILGFGLSVVLACLILSLHLKSKRNQLRINELLRKDFQRVQQLNEEKTRYFSILSHELRTPIFAITGLAKLMQNPANQTRENTEAIINSGNHLLHLVNNVLQHHKLEESAIVKLDETDFELVQTFTEVLQTISYLASEKDVEVVFDNQLKTNEYLRGDKQKLAQVLVNLLSNAIRYSHRSSRVELAVRPLETDGPERAFQFCVRDHGIGIAEEQMPFLFDYRKTTYDSENVAKGKLKGMGIGLFVVDRFVAAMGSRITVESKVGEGASFCFKLSFRNGKQPAAPSVSAAVASSHFTILVVDDIKVNLIVTQKTITSLGLKCITATDADPVVDIVEKEHIDLILMDLNMPLIDGYELSRKIRRAGYSIPIIAHTAVVKENIDHDALSAAQINDFLIKPYSQEDAKAMLAKYLGIAF